MESLGNIIVYFIIAIAIIVFSVLAVTTKKILRSATYLLFVLLATAGIYFQMGYEFLGAVQIAVYAGGILVLFVFAILLTHKPGEDAPSLSFDRKWTGILATVLAVSVILGSLLSCYDFTQYVIGNEKVADLSITSIGHYLLSTEHLGYLLPFEAVSVLLLACIIGAVVIARRR